MYLIRLYRNNKFLQKAFPNIFFMNYALPSALIELLLRAPSWLSGRNEPDAADRLPLTLTSYTMWKLNVFAPVLQLSRGCALRCAECERSWKQLLGRREEPGRMRGGKGGNRGSFSPVYIHSSEKEQEPHGWLQKQKGAWQNMLSLSVFESVTISYFLKKHFATPESRNTCTLRPTI